jgi:hypothetical protein
MTCRWMLTVMIVAWTYRVDLGVDVEDDMIVVRNSIPVL